MRRGNNPLNLRDTSFLIIGVLLLASSGYIIFNKLGDPYQGLDRLDAASYAESPKSFQGGSYLMEGKMDEILQVQAGRGKLVSIGVSASKGMIWIPLVIPEQLQSFNLQKGQELKIKVRALDNGLLTAVSIDKSP